MSNLYNYAFKKVDVESILNHYSLEYECRDNELWMCCPFHNETQPSLSMNKNKKIFRCWGCNEKGNIFTFVKKLEEQYSHDISYNDAVIKCCHICGIKISEDDINEYEDQFVDDISDIIIDDVQNDYQQSIFVESVLKKFYHRKNNYFLDRGFKQSTLDYLEMGFLSGDKKNAMNNRCVFPIRNESGQLIGWTGRTVLRGVEPKWLHAPKGEFKKYYCLYNIDKALDYIYQSKTINVVESVANVARMIESGRYNTVATLGSGLSDYQFNLLRQYAEKIVFWYDWDTGGFKGIQLALSYTNDYDNIFIAVTDYGIGDNGKSLDLGDVDNNQVNQTKIITAYEFIQYMNRRFVKFMESSFDKDSKIELPDGNIVICTNELKKKSDFPQLLPQDVIFLKSIDNLFKINKITLYGK